MFVLIQILTLLVLLIQIMGQISGLNSWVMLLDSHDGLDCLNQLLGHDTEFNSKIKLMVSRIRWLNSIARTCCPTRLWDQLMRQAAGFN